MKSTYYYILAIVAFVFMVSSCDPHEESTPNQGNIIPASDIKVSVTKDAENPNLLYFKLDTPHCLGKFVCEQAGINTTGAEFSKVIAWADTYIMTVQVYNKAGLSEPVNISFNVDNDVYATLLTGGEENPEGKSWRINNDVWGAIGCGPEGGNTNEWWNPAPNELSDALYNDDMIFYAAANKFLLKNYGDSFINESLGDLFPDGSTSDSFVTQYYTPSDDATWRLYRDEDTGESWLEINNGFPAYPVNPEALNGARYKIVDLTETDMHIVYLPGGISWHYLLTSTPR